MDKSCLGSVRLFKVVEEKFRFLLAELQCAARQLDGTLFVGDLSDGVASKFLCEHGNFFAEILSLAVANFYSVCDFGLIVGNECVALKFGGFDLSLALSYFLKQRVCR